MENNLAEAEFFENNDVTIITWFPWPSFTQTLKIQNDRGTREKRSAHACLPCFRRIFAIEIIRDNKTN